MLSFHQQQTPLLFINRTSPKDSFIHSINTKDLGTLKFSDLLTQIQEAGKFRFAIYDCFTRLLVPNDRWTIEQTRPLQPFYFDGVVREEVDLTVVFEGKNFKIAAKGQNNLSELGYQLEELTGVFMENQEFFGMNRKGQLEPVSKSPILQKNLDFPKCQNTLYLQVKKINTFEICGRTFRSDEVINNKSLNDIQKPLLARFPNNKFKVLDLANIQLVQNLYEQLSLIGKSFNLIWKEKLLEPSMPLEQISFELGDEVNVVLDKGFRWIELGNE